MTLPQEDPIVFPILYLLKGEVVQPTKEGYVIARSGSGEPLDIFDVSDRLFEKYHRLYIVDVEGMASNNPELDYLQELSRGREVWSEAGPRTADQVIDVIVGGATRAVLSLRLLGNPEEELHHALSLTGDIALEITTEGGEILSPNSELAHMPILDFARLAEEWGIPVLILSSPDAGWEAVAAMSMKMKVFVKGVRVEEMESLRASGAAGAILEVNIHG